MPIGSATEFGASWWLVVLLFAISIFRGAHASVFWVFSFGIMGSLIFPMLTPSFFGWYLYSAIMLLPLMLAFGQRERGLLTGGLTVVMILLSLKCNTGLVAEMVSNKIDHMKVLSMKEGITKHFGGLVSSWQPDLVVDYSEYNLIMFTPDKLEELAGHSIEQIGITERRKLDALKYMWNHSLSWLRNESGEVIACPKIDGYSRVLFAFGERLTHHKPPLNVSLRDWTERTFTRECPGWQLEYYEMHNQVHYLVIGNDVPQAIN